MAVTSETTTTTKYRAAMGYVTLYQENGIVKVEVNFTTREPEQLEELASLLNSVAAKMKEENND